MTTITIENEGVIEATVTTEGPTVVGGATTISDIDYEVTTSSAGYILKSPNGTRFRITISNDGTLNVDPL